MEYRTVGLRCAVDLRSLTLPITDHEALGVLTARGFRVIDVDLVALARACVQSSRYRRGAHPSEAPDIVVCSSFTKWLYGQRGIWLPRRSIQQRAFGSHVPADAIAVGDLVFTSGYIDYFDHDPSDGVGHVGIATDTHTVIHAANRTAGVIETPLAAFIAQSFRGARRYIPRDRTVVTLETPEHRSVETSDDLRWIILQTRPKRSHVFP